MRKLRSIIYLTGTRAEYGLMKETLKELDKRFDLQIIVTGTHLSKKYGYTINEIKKDKFKNIKKVKVECYDNDLKFMADRIGKLISKITFILNKVKPDLVLVEGDRGEQLAMTIAAATMNIPIAHTSGGVVSKSIDDSFRNAITKLAHIHLAPTKKSAKRIMMMNEECWRIHVVGTPMNLNFKKIDIYKRLNLDKNKTLILVLQHPVSTQICEVENQIKETMSAIKNMKYQSIIIYPNSDPGSDKMIKEIENCRNLPFVKIFKNLNNDTFMNLMANADVIVGNSSAGIVEAPFFKLPAVNIGIRQNNREHADNVINVRHKKSEIVEAIEKALTKKFYYNIRKNPYEVNGKAELNIANVLSKLKLDSKLLTKEPLY